MRQSKPGCKLRPLALQRWRRFARTRSEFEAGLESDHAGRAIAAEAYAQQAGGGRGGGSESAETGLGGRVSRGAGEDHAGEREIGVVEDVEELGFEAQFHVLAEREELRQVEIAPHKVGAAEGVASQGAKLAGSRGVAAIARAGARIDRGHKRIGIEPLYGARLGDSRNSTVAIQRDARHNTGELGSASVHDSVSVGRIGRA